ncbi:MAG: hypothetical protein ABF356_11595 [Polycyclovorans sp.]
MNDLHETIAELVGEGAAIRVAVAALLRMAPNGAELAELMKHYDAKTAQVLKEVALKKPDFGKTAIEAYNEVLTGLASQVTV